MSLTARVLSPQRTVYLVTGLSVLTALMLCWLNAPLIWDGSFELCRTLIDQRPSMFMTRFHSYVLWLPVLWLSWVTDNLRALVLAYGLPFCLAPAVSLLLSWWIVRASAPWLMVWAALGILAAALPGQIYIVNDSIFQQHIFWPVYLGLLVPVTRLQKAVLVPLALFQLSHAIGGLLFLGAAIATGYLAFSDRKNRRQWLIRTALCLTMSLIAFVKLALWFDPFSRTETTLHSFYDHFCGGVIGWPAIAMFFTWISAVLIWLGTKPSALKLSDNNAIARLLQRTMAPSTVICSLLAGAALIYWGAHPLSWVTALHYRRWAAPFTLPMFAFAFAETVKPPSLSDRTALMQTRLRVIWTWGIVFAVVLFLQARSWSLMSRRLMSEIQTYPAPIVPLERFEWLRLGPLDHWGTVSYVLLLQGRQPAKILLDKDGAAALKASPPKIAFAWWDVEPTSAVENWFDLSLILKQVREGQDRPPE